jgi:hypothetical protein
LYRVWDSRTSTSRYKHILIPVTANIWKAMELWPTPSKGLQSAKSPVPSLHRVWDCITQIIITRYKHVLIPVTVNIWESNGTIRDSSKGLLIPKNTSTIIGIEFEIPPELADPVISTSWSRHRQHLRKQWNYHPFERAARCFWCKITFSIIGIESWD